MLHGCRILQRSIVDGAKGPELEPVEVLRPDLDVILHAVRLEEELLVTPEGGDGVRAGHEPADQLFFTTALGGLIVSEYLEHYGVVRNDRQLVLEVVLILISPSVDIIRLNFDHEGPVRLLLLVTILIVLGDLIDGGGANVISHRGEVLSKGLTGALIYWLTHNGRPSVLKEVVRLLAVEGEHSVPVGGCHAISEELDTLAWNSFRFVRHSLSKFRNAHDAMLSSSEHTSVRRVLMGNELDLRVDSHWLNLLLPMNWIAVTDGVEDDVQI